MKGGGGQGVRTGKSECYRNPHVLLIDGPPPLLRRLLSRLLLLLPVVVLASCRNLGPRENPRGDCRTRHAVRLRIRLGRPLASRGDEYAFVLWRLQFVAVRPHRPVARLFPDALVVGCVVGQSSVGSASQPQVGPPDSLA